ncbi:LysR substrate-binding domain-containing protein [Mesobacterium pallidum]|uniref:LysR substrate-binding domain-containing protein n=1 Tax=Mesobacterium pallidum TaxID=2872037 RepID=UPI001EE2A410|nr:LysR substrate-binding domain-containing protein [Mesobacterium pallidum]
MIPVATKSMPARASILSRLHLHGLRHLEAVVRLGTFEAAARELNVTSGAVSQQIRRLEEGLGVSLFQRFGNRSEPTDAARQIAQTLSEAFCQIEQALEIGTGKSGSASVKIKLYQTWANRWLIPRLEAFSHMYPDISVEFETGIESVNAGWADLDMALSMRAEDSPDYTRVPLFTPHLVVVSTPAVAERLGPEVNLSRTARIASRNRMEDWPNWMAAAGLSADDKKPLMVFSNSTLLYEAALAGNGVAIAQLELVLQDLADGRLVRPAPTIIEAASPIVLLRPVSRVRRTAASVFHDWLVAEAAVLRARTQAYLAASSQDEPVTRLTKAVISSAT